MVYVKSVKLSLLVTSPMVIFIQTKPKNTAILLEILFVSRFIGIIEVVGD